MSEHDVLSAVTHGFRKSKESSTRLTEILEAKAEELGWKKDPKEKCSDQRSKSRHVARHYAEAMVKAIVSPSVKSPIEQKAASLEAENASLKDQIKQLELEVAKLKENKGNDQKVEDDKSTKTTLPLAGETGASSSSQPPPTVANNDISQILNMLKQQNEKFDALQDQVNNIKSEEATKFNITDLNKNEKKGFSLKEITGVTDAAVIPTNLVLLLRASLAVMLDLDLFLDLVMGNMGQPSRKQIYVKKMPMRSLAGQYYTGNFTRCLSLLSTLRHCT